VAYAIGVPEPVSIHVDDFGTGKISHDKLEKIIRKNFDMTPKGIVKTLDLRRPIYRKTACLFSACMRVGAILGQCVSEEEMRLGSYGANLGLAFQLVDDMLDFISTEEKLGKRRAMICVRVKLPCR
jgi:geranylgeranyl pyrophosphate synthase